MNRYFIILCPLIVSIACHTPLTLIAQAPEEHLEFKRISYLIKNNQATIQFAVVDHIWFQDSVGITQMSAVRSIQGVDKDTLFPIRLGYSFVDMRRRWAYEYRNLSDTAEIVRKYVKADSVGVSGGWNFNRPSLVKFDSVQLIGDTVVNGITYRKFSCVLYSRGERIPGDMYARCDRKGTIFQIDLGLSKTAGCPVVKSVLFTSDRMFPTQYSEIEFISNTFPDSIRKVFAAWKRNVQQYPVE